MKVASEREPGAGMALINTLAVAVFTETYTGEADGREKPRVWFGSLHLI